MPAAGIYLCSLNFYLSTVYIEPLLPKKSSLTMNKLQRHTSSGHNWEDPRHCIHCAPCRTRRMHFLRHKQAEAHQTGILYALDAGRTNLPAPTYRTRAIKVPRSNRSVTIQVPDLPHPVVPAESSPGPVTRKRPYWQPEHNELETLEPRQSLFRQPIENVWFPYTYPRQLCLCGLRA